MFALGIIPEFSPDPVEFTLNAKEGLDDHRVEMLPAFIFNHYRDFVMGQTFTIATIGTERVVNVRQRHDSSRQGNVFPDNPVGITGAIPALVVIQ